MQRRRATGVGPENTFTYVTNTLLLHLLILATCWHPLLATCSRTGTHVRGFAPTGVLCAHGAERQRAT